ncbi:hypothetical protein GGS23DRAFT_564674 [Durotheca rogersii]|uniref:uncharacterized protein n=1 Tax=Durotheca rogersii TaxID=419775 RepID=UPI00221E4B67|nr:uncharacterized protein GGS23DRAFT_564674 [Durotheca rogersii]KAI5863630.1 hypothetical protein GGS23DRAFT_564674 [Durotheca rogersii]
MPSGNLIRPSQSGAVQQQKILDRFHLFSKLPMELQLMIWDLWRASQPIIRHYMFTDSDGKRRYAAYDMSKGAMATRAFLDPRPLLTPGEAVDPMDIKIRLTGEVASADSWYELRNVSYDYNVIGRPLRSPFARVNFHKDFFFFHSWSEMPGHLRFMYPRINSQAPKQLDDGH